MNFLFHLYLSGDDPDLLTGNLMGDFVKGRLGEQYPPRLRRGIVLHRGIDSFAQQNPLFRRSRERIDPCYGLWRGVMVDMFYDHFLAAQWSLWSTEPFAAYIERAQLMVAANHRYLPERMHEVVPVIFDALLPSYREVDGVSRALERMARRVRRPNPLAGGAVELTLHYAALRDDFREFMPQVQQFVADFISVQVEG